MLLAASGVGEVTGMFTSVSVSGAMATAKEVTLLLTCCRSCRSLRGPQSRAFAALVPGVSQVDNNSDFLGKKPHRKHPGILRLPHVRLPQALTNAAQLLLLERPVRTTEKQAQALTNYLWSRHLPVEPEELQRRAVDLEKKFLEDQDSAQTEEKLREAVLHALRRTTYHWQKLSYNEELSLIYMAARLDGAFAAVFRAFHEIQTRVPEFQPQTLMDFGSGTGSVAWAAHSTWGQSLREYVCVDTSAAMLGLAEKLLKGGSESGKPCIPGVFFRQFLPVSPKVQFDVVVGAFALSELPSKADRTKVVQNLWRKTSRFLVLVENGTKAGHRLLMEARSLVLQRPDRPGQREYPQSAGTHARQRSTVVTSPAAFVILRPLLCSSCTPKMEVLLGVKIGCLLALLVLTLGCGLAPIYFKWFQMDAATGRHYRVLSLLGCISAGVFLGAGLMHMTAEALGGIESEIQKFVMQNSTGSTGNSSRDAASGYVEYPYGELVISLGFFFVFLLESLALQYCQGDAGGSTAKKQEEEWGGTHAFGLHKHPPVPSPSQGPLRALILLISLSFHSVFEGLAVGLQTTVAATVQLCVAVLAHKGLVVFSVGLRLLKIGTGSRWATFCILSLALMSPVGLALGLTVAGAASGPGQGLAQAVLEGVAAGTFLYVTFLEILPRELACPEAPLVKCGCVAAGFAFMALIALWA